MGLRKKTVYLNWNSNYWPDLFNTVLNLCVTHGVRILSATTTTVRFPRLPSYSTDFHYAKGKQNVRYFYYDSLRAKCSIYDLTSWFV